MKLIILFLCILISETLGVTIVQKLLDRTAYNLKYKYGVSMTPLWITIHNTANKATARAEASYLNTRTDNQYVSFHYAVDNIEALQLLPHKTAGYHAGDGAGDGNRKSIAIEICQSTNTDLSIRNKSTENGAWLAAKLLKDIGYGIARLRKHQDWSGKRCPHDILDRVGWENFKAKVQSYLTQLG